MLLPLGIVLEYLIVYVAIGLLYVKFVVLIMILYGECQALQLFALVMFCAVAPCLFVHF